MSSYERIRLKHLRDEAEGYLELGMAPQALVAAERAGEPTHYRKELLFYRGEALRELKRYREAIPFLQAATQEDAGDVHTWMALGWCYKRTSRIDLAIESLDRARKVRPNEAMIIYNLACYWSLARNKDLALQYLGRALTMDGRYREMIDDEPDFDAIRNDRDFQAMMSMIA